jgi:hypothetical protein
MPDKSVRIVLITIIVILIVMGRRVFELIVARRHMPAEIWR